MRALLGAFREQHAVIGQDGHRLPPDAGEAAHERRAVQGLELIQLRAVDDAGDDLAHVIGGADVLRDDPVQFGRIIGGGARLPHVQRLGLDGVQIGNDGANDLQRMLVVLGHMVDHA
ncbi:hypothetical protein D3C71_1704990 [compost metagenome]